MAGDPTSSSAINEENPSPTDSSANGNNNNNNNNNAGGIDIGPGTIAAIVLAVIIVCLFLLGVVGFLLWRRRRRVRKQSDTVYLKPISGRSSWDEPVVDKFAKTAALPPYPEPVQDMSVNADHKPGIKPSSPVSPLDKAVAGG